MPPDEALATQYRPFGLSTRTTVASSHGALSDSSPKTLTSSPKPIDKFSGCSSGVAATDRRAREEGRFGFGLSEGFG